LRGIRSMQLAKHRRAASLFHVDALFIALLCTGYLKCVD
jgi:hypothetical protein